MMILIKNQNLVTYYIFWWLGGGGSFLFSSSFFFLSIYLFTLIIEIVSNFLFLAKQSKKSKEKQRKEEFALEG